MKDRGEKDGHSPPVISTEMITNTYPNDVRERLIARAFNLVNNKDNPKVSGKGRQIIFKTSLANNLFYVRQVEKHKMYGQKNYRCITRCVTEKHQYSFAGKR